MSENALLKSYKRSKISGRVVLKTRTESQTDANALDTMHFYDSRNIRKSSTIVSWTNRSLDFRRRKEFRAFITIAKTIQVFQ